MRRTGNRLGALAALPLALAAASAEAKVHLQGKGGTITHDCGQDAAVEIDGTGTEIRLAGACERIDISGTNLVVRAEGVGKVEISGLNNTLEWQYAAGGRSRPSVEQNGIGHRIVKVEAVAKPAEPAPKEAAKPAPAAASAVVAAQPAAAAAKPAPAAPPKPVAAIALQAETSTIGVERAGSNVKITANGVRRRIDCGGAKVQVLGDDVVALLLGDCPNVQIGGDRCEVWIERVDNLQILGAGSQAFYVGSTDGDPVKVSLVGTGSTARAVRAEELAERGKR
jgi:hypothetical protein